jgi:hypothetical protein
MVKTPGKTKKYNPNRYGSKRELHSVQTAIPKKYEQADALKYIKNDIKWSAICAGIVLIVMIILYLFLH